MNRADAMRLSNLAGLGFYVHGDRYCDDVDLPRGTICTIQDVRIEYAERLIELAQAEVRKEIAARIVALRDSHCVGVNGDCADGGSNCDYVAAWNDALEIVRTQPAPGGAG